MPMNTEPPVNAERLAQLIVCAQQQAAPPYQVMAGQALADVITALHQLELANAEIARLRGAVDAVLESVCSVPPPYSGNAMDPVNDLRIVSGRAINRLQAALKEAP